MELDLQDRDQEQAEVLEEGAVVGEWADHALVQDRAGTASAHRVEMSLRISGGNPVMKSHVPNVVQIW